MEAFCISGNTVNLNNYDTSRNNYIYGKDNIPEEVKFLEAHFTDDGRVNHKEIFIGENSRIYDAHKAKMLEEVFYKEGQLKRLIVNTNTKELLYRYHEYKVYKKVLKRKSNYLTPVSYWECPEENIPFLKIHLKVINYHGKAYEEKKKALYWLFDKNPNKSISFYAKTLIVDERTIKNWKQEKFKRKWLSQKEIDKILSLYKRGKSRKDISKKLSIKVQTVYYHIRKATI